MFKNKIVQVAIDKLVDKLDFNIKLRYTFLFAMLMLAVAHLQYYTLNFDLRTSFL